MFYTQYGGFDVHANEVETQNKLWLDVSGAIRTSSRTCESMTPPIMW